MSANLMRDEFEAWYAPHFAGGERANMPKRRDGEYVRPQCEIAWRAFQAAWNRRTVEAQAADVGELLAALDAKDALHAEIRAKGMPPHTDYWHQSIAEADDRVNKARAALKGKKL